MGEFEVNAAALFHADTEQGITPMVALSYNVTPAMRTPLLRTLTERGWRDPSAVFKGDRHALTTGILPMRSTDGRTFRIEDGHDLLFEGVVVPPPGWTKYVHDLGAVGVLAGADLMSAPDWERRLPELARANAVLGSVATVTLTAAGSDDMHLFARRVLSGLRPVLAADTLDDVRFAVEDDRPHDAVLAAIRGAVTHQVLVPRDVFDMVQARVFDKSAFGRKDAWVLKRLLRKVKVTHL
ncbi:hypothetical protein L1080_033570 [Rhodococcus sp. MSC1_016]|jgi:hypothetical protein|uniref:hypothetical protein n=1 Tax=Rhodococcus sp. MSC1_016 TaxID=2909266 RepID=UPI00202E737F|nr:hypothetical protein [Rhodococcus sp. MSC1_016]